MEGETKTARIDQKLTNFFISLFFSPKIRIKGNQKHQFLKGDSINFFGSSVDHFSNRPKYVSSQVSQENNYWSFFRKNGALKVLTQH